MPVNRTVRTRTAQAPRPLKVMGIDASLSNTGICVRTDEGALFLRLLTPGDLRGSYRLSWLRRKLQALLEQHSPDLVVLEEYAVNRKMGANNVLGLAEWGGIIRMLVWEMSIDLLLVRPSSMKMVIAGKGNAKKPQVAAAIHRDFGTLIGQNDVADACGLMLTGEIKMASPRIPPSIMKSARLGKLAETEIVAGAKMKLIA